MVLPGGPSDKLGNRYEMQWTVYCVIKVLAGEYDSIHLEPPGEGKTEFITRIREVRQHHQAKRQLPSGNWTLTKLQSEGILSELGNTVTDPDLQWVFVSGHPAPEIRDLTDFARVAQDWNDYQKFFNKARRQIFRKLQN